MCERFLLTVPTELSSDFVQLEATKNSWVRIESEFRARLYSRELVPDKGLTKGSARPDLPTGRVLLQGHLLLLLLSTKLLETAVCASQPFNLSDEVVRMRTWTAELINEKYLFVDVCAVPRRYA